MLFLVSSTGLLCMPALQGVWCQSFSKKSVKIRKCRENMPFCWLSGSVFAVLL